MRLKKSSGKLYRKLSNRKKLLLSGKTISPDSKIVSLVHFIDSNGILRAKGRLGKADLPFELKQFAQQAQSSSTVLVCTRNISTKAFITKVSSILETKSKRSFGYYGYKKPSDQLNTNVYEVGCLRASSLYK